MVPVLESVKSSVVVAVCADPVPVNSTLLYGEPSEDGQSEPPPLVSCADEVSPVRIRLPFAFILSPEVF